MSNLKRFTGTVNDGCRYTEKGGCWMEAGETFTGYFIGYGNTAEGRGFFAFEDEEGAFVSVWLDEVSIEFGAWDGAGDAIDSEKPLKESDAVKLLARFGFTYSHSVGSGSFSRYNTIGAPGDIYYIDLYHPPQQSLFNLLEDINIVIADFHFSNGQKEGIAKAKEGLGGIIESWKLRGGVI